MSTAFQQAFEGKWQNPHLSGLGVQEYFYDSNKTVTDADQVAIATKGEEVQSPFKKAVSHVTEKVREDHGSLLAHALVDISEREALRQAIHKIVLDEKVVVPDLDSKDLAKQLVDEIAGLGPIESFMSDDTVTEVMINGPKIIYIEQNGKQQRTNVTFEDEEHLTRYVRKMLNLAGAVVNTSNPIVDARLPNIRINVVIPPVARLGTTVTIRKFPPLNLSIEEMIRNGQGTEEMFELLDLCVQGGANIFIAGPTGSGKTTLLKVLAGFIPDLERTLSIEDTEEGRLYELYPDKHFVPLECRFTDKDETNIDMARLLKSALRMYPYRLIVGEVRGPEANIMIESFNTGHDGSFATGHANGAVQALRRIMQMILRAGLQVSAEMIMETVCSAINIVVFQKKLKDGTRRITEIIEVRGSENGHPIIQNIYAYRESVGKFVRNKNGFISKDLADRMVLRRITREGLEKWVRKEDLDVIFDEHDDQHFELPVVGADLVSGDKETPIE